MTLIDCWKRVLGAALFGVALGVAGCGGGDDSASPGNTAGSNAPSARYGVGGTVSALAGSGLVLQNNGGDDLAITANGSFAFATKLAAGSPYAVSVKTQPSNPAQTCTISNGSGTISAADVPGVAVVCAMVGGGGGGGTPGFYAGNFSFDGSFDEGRGTYAGEAQLRFDFEGDFPGERRYRLATATAVFTKWQHESATKLCLVRADSASPIAFNGFLIFNMANSTYAITGGLLVFQATSTCTDKRSGAVEVAPSVMQLLIISADKPADPGYLPYSGDGSVLLGSRTYVSPQNALTQHSQWRLERR